MDRLLDIKPAYPKTDASAPDSTVKMTYKYIKRGLCRSILKLVKTHRIPVVKTILGQKMPALKTGKGEPITIMNYILSCGTSTKILDRFKATLDKLGLGKLLGKNITAAYDPDPIKYFDDFTAALRNTDIVWTKPSELVFYAGLALPILCAPCIGPHEHLNQEWVTDLGAGIAMAGDASTCNEWLFDILDEGRFAQAAWNGFMNVPRKGTFNVEKLVRFGKM